MSLKNQALLGKLHRGYSRVDPIPMRQNYGKEHYAACIWGVPSTPAMVMHGIPPPSLAHSADAPNCCLAPQLHDALQKTCCGTGAAPLLEHGAHARDDSFVCGTSCVALSGCSVRCLDSVSSRKPMRLHLPHSADMEACRRR
jgi:hypothetical protein